MIRTISYQSNQVEDWYSVSLAELKDVGFRTKVTKSKLIELLSEKYPDHKWDKLYLLRGKYGQQKKLERAVISLFPVGLSSLLYSSNLAKRCYQITLRTLPISLPTCGKMLNLSIQSLGLI